MKEVNTAENREAFWNILECAAGKRRFFSDFKEWLDDTDFFTAPASTKYHGCYTGGLAAHSLRVASRLMERKDIASEWQAAAVAALLHDVCKIDSYVQQEKDGIISWTYNKEKQLPVGHGERSIILIQQHGLTLTMEELVAIRWHMGAFDDAFRGGCRDMSDAFRKYPLALQLHLADMEATYLDEKE